MSEPREWQMFVSRPTGEWLDLAEALGWVEERDPVWKTPEARTSFWRDMRRAKERAVTMREAREALREVHRRLLTALTVDAAAIFRDLFRRS